MQKVRMQLRSGECKKFSPNIFNKTKCSNCFKQKEEHSLEALESNRATRKVAKCGYLFVAPGWDFANPINRTKRRWQRRWFILYDDGELSYSLDEQPDTVPQACIDMNKVVAVEDAEEATGNPYSLSITAHEQIHFVKATCREEAKWWLDVLSLFPSSKGRHKRNPMAFSVNKSITTATKLQPVTRNVYLECASSIRETLTCNNENMRNRRLQNQNRNFKDDVSNVAPPNWPQESTSSALELSRRLLLAEYEPEDKVGHDMVDCISRQRQRQRDKCHDIYLSRKELAMKDNANDPLSNKQIRGDPDGCGLDLLALRYSPNSEMRSADSRSDDSANVKKGWLMKQALTNLEWTKYWFVLRGAAFMYYRDPTAEDQGILDGVIDLSVTNNISEVQVNRNYGFQISCWDDKKYTLSAVTAGIRTNWISALKKATGTHDDKLENDDECPSTPRSVVLSSDEEYRTASEGGRRESCSDWGETLPPSPPLNRTPISRVKEKARGVTRTRLYNSRHSKSSPPSSRNCTLDIPSTIRSDFAVSCHDITQQQNERAVLTKKLEKQSVDLEDARRQLSSVLRQLSCAEDELARLRQKQRQLIALEKQLDDLKMSLKSAEETLKEKSMEISEYELLKRRYAEEKDTWWREIEAAERELRETREKYSEARCELLESNKLVEQLGHELQIVSQRLATGVEENETLYRRLREVEGRGCSWSLSSMRETRARSLDSLSDLTNVDLDPDFSQLDRERVIEEYGEIKVRFEKAVREIRAMKKELRESHVQADRLELSLINARQDMKSKQDSYEAEIVMMAARIQDLTNKLSNAEKQIRTLKQKLSRSEVREKRRSLSLKGRESFAICKELDEKLTSLERKITYLGGGGSSDFSYDSAAASEKENGNAGKTEAEKLAGLSLEEKRALRRARRKSLESATCSEPMKILLRLNSLESKVAEASQKIIIKPATSVEEEVEEEEKFSGDVRQKITDTYVAEETKKVENLLKNKLRDIYDEKNRLLELGLLTEEAKLDIIAEKLAYESVLLNRLREIVTFYNDDDLREADKLIDQLDGKIKGQSAISTANDYKEFSAILLRETSEMNKCAEEIESKNENGITSVSIDFVRQSSEIIENKSKSLLERVDIFISDSIEKLSDIVANKRDEENGSTIFLEEFQDAARKIIDSRLVESEVAHFVIPKCGIGFLNKIDRDKESFFYDVVCGQTNLEKFNELAYNFYEIQIAKLSEEITTKCAVKLKTNRMKNFVLDKNEENKLTRDLIDVVTLKCLLEAKMHFVRKKITCPDYKLSIGDEATVKSEVKSLYAKLQRDLNLSNEEKRVCDSLETVGIEVSALRNSVEDLVRKRGSVEQLWNVGHSRCDDSNSSNDSGSSWLDNICRRCAEIKEQIVNLQMCLMQSQECQKCVHLQHRLTQRESDFEEEKRSMQREQQKELSTLRFEHESEKNKLITKFERKEILLRERAKKLEKRLEALGCEYSQQMKDNVAMSSEGEADVSISEESINYRYQAEIQQLRALCEKGLTAMENSHKRTICELEEKHRNEMESLRAEKEQALAEETRATLAALDAMRKAHEAEVHKEIVKFKTEYMKKSHSTQDLSSLHKQHEAEMEEIKKEILSLSEKYSIKCVESANLEEELKLAKRKLSQAQIHITQLDNRNKQLREHIVSETMEESSSNDLHSFQTPKEKDDELDDSRRRVNEQEDAPNILYANSTSEQFDTNGVESLTRVTSLEGTRRRITECDGPRKHASPQNDSRVSLDKSTISSHSKVPKRPISPQCNIDGMVAERKKIFER